MTGSRSPANLYRCARSREVGVQTATRVGHQFRWDLLYSHAGVMCHKAIDMRLDILEIIRVGGSLVAATAAGGIETNGGRPAPEIVIPGKVLSFQRMPDDPATGRNGLAIAVTRSC